MMDIFKFINLIYDRQCLWDQDDPNYHLRDYQYIAWEEISVEMNMPVEDIKKKWRGLRDTFGRELKKATKTKSLQTSDAELVSKWPYFRALLFLKDAMSRRNLQSNNTDFHQDADSEESYEIITSKIIDSTLQNTYQTPIKKFKVPIKGTLRKRKLEEIDEKPLQIDDEELKYYGENLNESYDAQFLMSLLPFLQDVPKCRKLIVRNKLQQVFIEEQNLQSSSLESNYSSLTSSTQGVHQ